MSRQTRCYRYDFRGHLGFPATASGVGSPWTIADTSSAGAPTFGAANGGGYSMAFSATSEVQNLCLYFGDVLSFDIDEIIRAWFIVKTAATLDTATSLAFGLCSARNDAIDSLTAHASFRCIGSNDVVVESDDGTTDKDDVATGLTLGATFKRFEINFAERNTSVEAPSLSLGRKSNIGFYGANTNGSLRRVASGTRFDMTAYTAGLQPYVQLQKTADTAADSVTVLEIGVEVNLPAYA
jgi:hypothetical protein